MARLPITVAITVVAGAMLAAQAADFSGTWQLDDAKSKVVPAAGIAGLIPNGAPKVLHVTHPSNGTLIVESQINEGQSRIYKPNGKTSTPVGQGGSITMTAKWNGRTLSSEGTSQAANGTTVTVKESYTLSADGKTLTVDVSTTNGTDTQASSIVYVRAQAVGPCESWPTPCKRTGG